MVDDWFSPDQPVESSHSRRIVGWMKSEQSGLGSNRRRIFVLMGCDQSCGGGGAAIPEKGLLD